MADPKDLFAAIPRSIDPPCAVDGATESISLWSGESQLSQGVKTREGNAAVTLETLPRPNFKFEFREAAETQEKPAADAFRDLFDAGGLQPGEMVFGPLIGRVRVVPELKGRIISGRVEASATDEIASFSSARYLVINGPLHHGSFIQKENGAFTGRLRTTAGDSRITIDRLSSDPPVPPFVFAFTHAAEIHFESPVPINRFNDVLTAVFRVLSLMRGRWVGLVGPWLYDGESLKRIVLHGTKVNSEGNSFKWCPDIPQGVFEPLFKCVWIASQDQELDAAIQTAMHWLIETNQCVAGVEGSLVLQQAALESLAWFEIVQRRKLCSVAGFERLPAADKIRWFASLFSIPTAVPAHSAELVNYAKEYPEVSDLPGILVDVRNALVHGSPNKVKRLFERGSGGSERIKLWYLVSGLLEQAVLAAIDYRGKIVRRDLDVKMTYEATKQVPWSPELPGEGDLRSA